MRLPLAAVLLLALTSAAEARRPRVRAESWSAVAGAGFEAIPDSVGNGLSPLGLFGFAGTIRVTPMVCVDARWGIGATEDGSDTVRVSETRIRLDARPAFCPALHSAFTLVLAAGPAAGLSLHEARVGDGRQSYSALDVGFVADAAALLRVGPIVFRFDVDGGVLRRLLLGMYLAVGVAL